MTEIWVAVVAFALAAMGGATMLALRVKGKPLPMPLAVLHGLGAATGLVCLVLAALGGHAPRLAIYALIAFGAAALGGVYLFSFHVRGKTHPVALIVGHGAVAATGLALLLLALRG